jgi:hypothetical protein
MKHAIVKAILRWVSRTFFPNTVFYEGDRLHTTLLWAWDQQPETREEAEMRLETDRITSLLDYDSPLVF